MQTGSKPVSGPATRKNTTAASKSSMKTPICSMMVDLNVLDHLGITLGQHCRETVANTWNADVQHVSINLYKGNGVITIKDDVHGLSIEDVNGKYLHIGYRQRTGGANRPPQGTARHPLQDQCRLAYHCRTEKGATQDETAGIGGTRGKIPVCLDEMPGQDQYNRLYCKV